MEELKRAIEDLKKRKNTPGTCLGDIRQVLSKFGLRLPPPMPRPHNTAIANFEELVQDPQKYGWKAVHHVDGKLPVPYALVYFKKCGDLGDGRQAGHIAILDVEKMKHYANADHAMTRYWGERLIGAFVPVE